MRSESPPLQLQVNNDPRFQTRTHYLQRAGWVVMFLFVLSAAAGWFGPSRFSEQRITTGDTSVEFPRFARKDTQTSFSVTLEPARPRTDGVWLSNEIIENIEVTSVLPVPARVERTADGARFLFATPATPKTVKIEFQVKPKKAGRIHGTVTRDRGNAREGTPIGLRQFVYF